MKRAPLLLAVVAAVLVSSAAAEFSSIPAPKRSAQLNLGEDDAPILLEVHVDLLCPDCAEAWTTLKDLAQAYGPEKLQLGIRLYPLPHHRNGFIVAQAVQAVKAANESAVFKFIDIIFDAQNRFWDAQRSIGDVSDELAQLAEASGTSRAAYLGKMATQSVDLATRAEWRLGASRGISATPAFFVNGALTGADEHWSVDLWRSVLDPLLVGEGESHGTQHWSLNEWRAALGPLLESHKRKTDPLLSAVAARQEAARTGDKPTAGEVAAAKATAEVQAKAEVKVVAAKAAADPQPKAAARAEAAAGGAAASRLEELKKRVTGGGAAPAGATADGATASAAAKKQRPAAQEKSLLDKIEEGIEQGIEAAEEAVAGAAAVLTGGAAGGAGAGAAASGSGAAAAGSSMSEEQQKKVREMKARLGLLPSRRLRRRLV